jgi:uncharacterized glyoxalase superfamily protein PhnB
LIDAWKAGCGKQRVRQPGLQFGRGADAHFAILGEGGTVILPLEDTFWGARFGMVEDKFSIQRMFNFEKVDPAA